MPFFMNKVLWQNMSLSSSISYLLSSIGAPARLFTLVFLSLSPLLALAQWPYGSPTTPDAQRNALSVVRSQVGWLDNATRTAPNYGAQGADNVWQQFQALRGAYAALKQTLTPQQATQGANSFAELDAGLDIIQEVFPNYQDAVASGQPVNSALREMCQVLRQTCALWLQELNKSCSRVRVGWG
jgi:hypothetical protein